MADLRIQPRRDEDMSACVDALAAVHKADGYPVNWPSDPARWLTPDGLLEAWAALDGHAALGHVAITRTSPELAGGTGLPAGQLASVARLFVTPPARRYGVAQALLAAAEAAASARGLRLVLEVEDGGRAAISLYERSGWRHVGTAPGDWTTVDGRTALMHAYLAPVRPAPEIP
ncbi:GNAT family N-acetyltransferase [Streptomyces sp. NPDC059373]